MFSKFHRAKALFDIGVEASVVFACTLVVCGEQTVREDHNMFDRPQTMPYSLFIETKGIILAYMQGSLG